MLRQLFRLRSRRAIAALTLCAVTFVVTAALAGAGSTPGGSDDSSFIGGRRPLEADESNERAVVLARDDAFISRRTAGTAPLDPSQAGALRAKAAGAAKKLQKEQVPSGPATFGDAWLQIGPNPIVQVTRGSGTFAAMAGRIGALAIRPSNGKFILGAAQGGIWLYDAASKTWSSKTADTTTQ